ncbi:hypothetical protein Q1695_011679 [Nippostrongylus brasiliensis]|nr:hypothetical protein Q1695_011679 [Nippostrongylus brasiliensis]
MRSSTAVESTSSQDSDFVDDDDEDSKIATLFASGFDGEDIEVALRESNNDITKACALLSSSAQASEEVADGGTIVKDDSDAGPSSDIFPTPSFKCVRRVANTEDCTIFANSSAVMRCVEAAKSLLATGVSDPVCTEFVDVYLPKCILLHVSPPEPMHFNDTNLGLSVNFCREVVPLIAKRLSSLPVPCSLCHIMKELFNPCNRMLLAYRRLSPPELQNRSFDSEKSYCDHRKTTSGKEHTHRLLQELIDLFISSSGLFFINNIIKENQSTLLPKDVAALVDGIETFRDFVDGTKLHLVLHSIANGSLRIVDEIPDKLVRDALCRAHVIDTIDKCSKWIEFLEEDPGVCNRCRLKFFLRCITCNQLDAKVFAFHELGKFIAKLNINPNILEVDLLNTWLRDNNILKHALQGNMDQPTYLEKIQPVISYMTSEMSANDLANIWSLRNGRMGVSADNFSTILVLIGRMCNIEQLGWLEQMFIKCFHANETRMYDRVFLCCKDIAIQSEIPSMSGKMLAIMWNLIEIVRGKSFATTNAIKWFTEVILDKKDLTYKDMYIKKSLECLSADSQCMIDISSLVLLRELLEMTSNMITRARNGRTSSRGFRARDHWGDLSRLEANLDEVKGYLRDMNLAKILYEKLSTCKEMATKNPQRSSSLTAVELSEGCNYSFIVKNLLAVLKWLITNQVVIFSNDTANALWNTLTSGGSSSEASLLFDWLSEFSVSSMMSSTLTTFLYNFCNLPAASITLDALKCLCHLLHSCEYHQLRGQVGRRCMDYMWEVLEVSENNEVADEIMQRLIEFGSYEKDRLQYAIFLNVCNERLRASIMEHFRRNSQLRNPTANLSTSFLRCGIKSGDPQREKSDDNGDNEEDMQEAENSQDSVPCDEPSSSSTPPIGELSSQHILRRIHRLLQLIAIFVESEDNLFFMSRQYPPHGTLVPGRPLRISCRMEDDPITESTLVLRTNSHESIGQFRSRLSNRLHFKSVGSYKIYVQRDDKPVEIQCIHEWKTLEQVGLATDRDGICESEEIEVVVRSSRQSLSSVTHDSDKGLPEKQLPGVMVHDCNGMFLMLHTLLQITDTKVQQSCRRILSLIPVDPAVLAALNIEDPSKRGHEKLNETVLINDFLTTDSPYMLLYTLEVMAGLLVPTCATRNSVAISNRLARAILHSKVYHHLLKLLAAPHMIAPLIQPTDRTRIFELLTLIFGVLLLGQSVLSSAITNDGQCLSDLQKCKNSDRRKDPLYEDLSTLTIESSSLIANLTAEEFNTLITTIRDAIWLCAAGWVVYSIRLPIYDNYFGTLSRYGNNDAVREAQSKSAEWIERTELKVPDAPSASLSIRSDHAEGLNARDDALTNDLLVLMTRCMKTRLISSGSTLNPTELISREENSIDELGLYERQRLLELCTTGPWREFWVDILVYSKTGGVRLHAKDALISVTRCIPCEKLICTILRMLLETVEDISSLDVKPNDSTGRLVSNALELHLCVASVLDVTRSISDDVFEIWRLIGRDPVKVASQIFDLICALGANSNYGYINADFLCGKLCVLKSILGYTDEKNREELGRKYMNSVLSRCIFSPVDREWAGPWESKNAMLALEILADLSEGVPQNSVCLTQFLKNYFGESRDLEWEFRPLRESRVLNHVGLQNAGGTCYMNSVLQQIFAIPGLADQLFSFDFEDGGNDENSQLLVALQSVFTRLAKAQARLYVPREMWDTFRFYGADKLDTRQQHDAVDFFTELIDRVDSALEAQKKPLLFRPRLGGKFNYEYICYGCFHRHDGADEEFLAINLELQGTSLEDCLEHYVRDEILEGDNAYVCSVCKEKRSTLRRGSFCELPNTLAIQLKRFSYDISGRVDKKNDFCSFPMLLDMAPYCTEARAVTDRELKSLFNDVYNTESEGSLKSNVDNRLYSSEQRDSPTSPSRWGRKRRKTSSPSSLSSSDYCEYELVGVLVHSGGARAGHYVSYVKERRPEMVGTPTYGKWIELNDADVRIFPATAEAIESEWFGGSFTASTSALFSSRIDLPKERLRSYSAYVLLYERKEPFCSVSISNRTSASSIPSSLLKAVENENKIFFQERDLFSSEYAYAVSKAVSHFVTYLESDKRDTNEEDESMAVQVFNMFFDYCCNSYWRLSYESRQSQVFDMSVSALRALVRLSQAVRQQFFELIVECNYKVFYSMLTSPDDVCSAWWRLLGDALCCWLEDSDADRISKSASKLPSEIIARTIAQISYFRMVDTSHEWCFFGALKCMSRLVFDSPSGAFCLISDGALQVVSDLISTDWAANVPLHSNFDVRSARHLTLRLFVALLKCTLKEPQAEKYLPPKIYSHSLVLQCLWMYTEYPNDRKLCELLEETLYLLEQTQTTFLEDAVKLVLNEIWVGIYKDSWPGIMKLFVAVCRKLDDSGVGGAFRYLAMLLDGCSGNNYLNEKNIPEGLISQAEELILRFQFNKARVYVKCFNEWQREGEKDSRIAEVFSDNDRKERIACCSLRLVGKESTADPLGKSDRVTPCMSEKEFEDIYARVRITSMEYNGPENESGPEVDDDEIEVFSEGLRRNVFFNPDRSRD